MQGVVADWFAANERLNVNLRHERRREPVVIDAVAFRLDEFAFRLASATVTVFTTLELFDREQVVCIVNADNERRTEGWHQLCRVVGEVVAECVCDESGIRVTTEGGLELLCRSDGGGKSYAVEFDDTAYRC